MVTKNIMTVTFIIIITINTTSTTIIDVIKITIIKIITAIILIVVIMSKTQFESIGGRGSEVWEGDALTGDTGILFIQQHRPHHPHLCRCRLGVIIISSVSAVFLIIVVIILPNLVLVYYRAQWRLWSFTPQVKKSIICNFRN